MRRSNTAAVEETGARVCLPFVHAARAELVGDAGTYQSELREAHRLFVEMGAPAQAEAVARRLRIAGRELG
jgi:hypothetical protein